MSTAASVVLVKVRCKWCHRLFAQVVDGRGEELVLKVFDRKLETEHFSVTTHDRRVFNPEIRVRPRPMAEPSEWLSIDAKYRVEKALRTIALDLRMIEPEWWIQQGKGWIMNHADGSTAFVVEDERDHERAQVDYGKLRDAIRRARRRPPRNMDLDLNCRRRPD